MHKRYSTDAVPGLYDILQGSIYYYRLCVYGSPVSRRCRPCHPSRNIHFQILPLTRPPRPDAGDSPDARSPTRKKFRGGSLVGVQVRARLAEEENVLGEASVGSEE